MRVAKTPKSKQSLAAQAGTGEAVSSEYVARRKQIEHQVHKPNDDGTERLFYKRVGSNQAYNHKNGSPLDDHDDPSRLCEFGLPIRDLNRLIENGCEEIADVRSAAMNDDEIPGYRNAGMVTLKNVRAALKKADRVRR